MEGQNLSGLIQNLICVLKMNKSLVVLKLDEGE